MAVQAQLSEALELLPLRSLSSSKIALIRAGHRGESMLTGLLESGDLRVTLIKTVVQATRRAKELVNG